MKLTMAQRRNMPASQFAVPSKAPGPGSYPMPDKGHMAAAEGLAGMHGASDAVKGKIRAKARKTFGQKIGMSDE